MDRTLIVARLNPGPADAIAEIFAESDATELPHMIGVSRRTLFRFHDLYFHLVEADGDVTPNLYKARSHPLYDDIQRKLARHVSPYDPGWQEPKDAMAVPFYSWQCSQPRGSQPRGSQPLGSQPRGSQPRAELTKETQP